MQGSHYKKVSDLAKFLQLGSSETGCQKKYKLSSFPSRMTLGEWKPGWGRSLSISYQVFRNLSGGTTLLSRKVQQGREGRTVRAGLEDKINTKMADIYLMTPEQKNKRVFPQPQVKLRAQIHSAGTHFDSVCLLPLAFTYLHPQTTARMRHVGKSRRAWGTKQQNPSRRKIYPALSHIMHTWQETDQLL